jgi:hypothetical protein
MAPNEPAPQRPARKKKIRIMGALLERMGLASRRSAGAASSLSTQRNSPVLAFELCYSLDETL